MSEPAPLVGDARLAPAAALAPRVAVAGATGFVGRALCAALQEHHEVVALGRRVPRDRMTQGENAEPGPGLRWKRCDLFSLRQIEAALEGVSVAFYLVHSMMPNTRLTQGRFEDLDLLLADNFARAAERAGVERIVYLGGLVPVGDDASSLSSHLASRVEVEHALAAHGVPVTALRAGLVVGAGGSSLDILVRLVKRLPIMVCPRWTLSKTQPIALEDVVEALAYCCDEPETAGRVCEVGGPDVLSYRDMMGVTARVLGRRRIMLPVPLVTPALSELWVSLVTKTSRALVAPLIESLRHPMVVTDRWLQDRMGQEPRPFATALQGAARAEGLATEPVVRSVQRLPLPRGRDATWVGQEYLAWLPRFLRYFLRVETSGRRAGFYFRGLARPLLELDYDESRSASDRALFVVVGGLLAGDSPGIPRLEFRTAPNGREVLAAVQDFRPSLPWWVYASTQALAHLFVMRGFDRHLRRLARAAQSTATHAGRPDPTDAA